MTIRPECPPSPDKLSLPELNFITKLFNRAYGAVCRQEYYYYSIFLGWQYPARGVLSLVNRDYLNLCYDWKRNRAYVTVTKKAVDESISRKREHLTSF